MALNSHHHVTLLANGASTIVGNAVVQMLLLYSTNTKPLAIAKALSPERHCLNAVARAPEQRSPPLVGFSTSIGNEGVQVSWGTSQLILATCHIYIRKL